MKTHEEQRRFVRAAEVASQLGVTTRTVQTYIARGIVPSVRVGGARLVPVGFVDSLERRAQARFAPNGGMD